MLIGIDLGGSHIGVGLVDNDGTIVEKEEIFNVIKCEKEVVIEHCIKSINKILERKRLSIYQIDSIGIGAPGVVNNGRIVRAENMGLYNFEIVNEIKKVEGYENVPVYIENDANVAAIAELFFGNLKNINNGIFVSVGTGIGAGIIINKKLFKGSYGMAGEIGHICIENGGKLCNCGQVGCYERYASMKNLRMQITKELNLSKEISGKEIEVLLENGNEKVVEIFNKTIDYLSVGLVNIINLFDPEKVVLGGSIVYYKKWMLEKINKIVNQKVYNKGFTYPIELATVGNDAGIIGAAFQKFGK